MNISAIVHDVQRRQKIGVDRAINRVFAKFNWRKEVEKWHEKEAKKQPELMLK